MTALRDLAALPSVELVALALLAVGLLALVRASDRRGRRGP